MWPDAVMVCLSVVIAINDAHFVSKGQIFMKSNKLTVTLFKKSAPCVITSKTMERTLMVKAINDSYSHQYCSYIH